MPNRPNIMLLVMESIRPDFMGCYGGKVPNTPNLELLAERGVIFKNAISAGAWTVSSIASMFTGLYPSNHRLIAGNNNGFREGIRTLPELLRDIGYQTFAIFSTNYLTDLPEFFRGFDNHIQTQDLPASFTELLRHPAILLMDKNYVRLLIWNILNGRDSRTYYMTLSLGSWLERLQEDKPFFSFIHFQIPHAPYNPPRPFRPNLSRYGFNRAEKRRLSDRSVGWQYMAGVIDLEQSVFEYYKELYAAEIRYLDWRIGEIFDILRNKELLENTIVIAIGDHGENIGDHELMFHNFSIYDTTIHIPWIMTLPGSYNTPVEIDTPVSHTDLLPTILEWLGEEPREVQEFQGQSLTSLFSVDKLNERRDRIVFSELERPKSALDRLREVQSDIDISKFDKAMKAARTHQWKYFIESNGSEYLYDILADPFENHNLADDYSDMLIQLNRNVIAALGDFDLQCPTFI